MRMLMRVMIAPRAAPEGHEHEPPGIERRHRRPEHQQHEGEVGARGKGALDHRVLRDEARKADMRERDPHPRDRERPRQHRREGERDLVPEPAIVAHVLLMVHRMDDRARAEKEHRLEEGVGKEVEHRHRIDPHPRRHEHVAKLRAGRIGDDALDVVLHKPDGRGKKGRERPDIDDQRLGLGREFIERRHPADEEHARRHHRRGMDERRDGRRPLHRVWQPGVQEKLRRLAHRPDEEKNRDQIGRVPLGPEEMHRRLGKRRRRGKDIVEAHAVGQQEEREDPERKAEIAHAVDDEGLDRGRIGRGFAPVEADQQIGGNTHPLPAEEHLHEVVGRHEHQHREGEERQIGEEARLVVLAMPPVVVMRHVAEGIEMHERRDGRDDDEHDRRQPVEPDRPFGAEAADIEPAQHLGLARHPVEAEKDDP